jgi:hypothetical protein
VKAILEFDLPKEDEEFLSTLHGCQWKAVVVYLDNMLRNNIKWSDKFLTPDEIRDAIVERLDHFGLRLFD